MKYDTVPLTVRLLAPTYRKLRFLAADQNISLNEAINLYLQEATAKARVSVPTELIGTGRPQE
jgi:hypothetical protein